MEGQLLAPGLPRRLYHTIEPSRAGYASIALPGIFQTSVPASLCRAPRLPRLPRFVVQSVAPPRLRWETYRFLERGRHALSAASRTANKYISHIHCCFDTSQQAWSSPVSGPSRTNNGII